MAVLIIYSNYCNRIYGNSCIPPGNQIWPLVPVPPPVPPLALPSVSSAPPDHNDPLNPVRLAIRARYPALTGPGVVQVLSRYTVTLPAMYVGLALLTCYRCKLQLLVTVICLRYKF